MLKIKVVENRNGSTFYIHLHYNSRVILSLKKPNKKLMKVVNVDLVPKKKSEDTEYRK